MSETLQIDDSYLDEFTFGKSSGTDALLLVIASVTPNLETDEDLPLDASGELIYASQDNPELTLAGLRHAAEQMSRLLHALTRPFNDDDCDYGCEYYEGNMSYPLRSLTPCPSKGYGLLARFNWLPSGEAPGEAEEEAIAFYDPLYNHYKTAFFLALTRGSDPGGYMLYWDHIEPYLASFTQVYLAAYNHEEKAVTLQEYYEGEIDEEHDNISAEQWLSRLLLSSKEEHVFRQAE